MYRAVKLIRSFIAPTTLPTFAFPQKIVSPGGNTGLNKKYNNMENKVFVIGMFRTGTSSVGRALSILGYNVLGIPWYFVNDVYWKGMSPLVKYFRGTITDKVYEYDAFKDFPWMFLYKELHEWFPGSKFIYTERDVESVVKSEINCYEKGFVASQKPDPKRIKKRFLQHKEKIYNYFSKDNKNFLSINVTEGEGWDKICSFLKKEVPKEKFPHINKGGIER